MATREVRGEDAADGPRRDQREQQRRDSQPPLSASPLCREPPELELLVGIDALENRRHGSGKPNSVDLYRLARRLAAQTRARMNRAG
jgi:hypothetical protein